MWVERWQDEETHVLVLLLPGRAVRVVEALEDLRAQIVRAVGDVEARAVVERLLVRGHVRRVPAEALGADARQGLVVEVLWESMV